MKKILLFIACAFGVLGCKKQEIYPSSAENSASLNKQNASTLGAWVEIFSDEFDSDLSQWELTERYDYNSIYCYYDSAVPRLDSVDGKSALVLTATKTGVDAYQSGHVKSDTSFVPGTNEEIRIVASIKLVAKDGGVFKPFKTTYGAWPAFWTVNESSWPTYGEIDIMEGYSKGDTVDYACNLFYGTNPMDDELENSLVHHYGVGAGWHLYEELWRNDNDTVSVTIKVDGNVKRTYVNADHADLNLNAFDDHNIILNLNVGDTDDDIFDHNSINLWSKAMMWVNFVKVFKRTI